MTALTPFWSELAEHGPGLLVGVTIVLAGGLLMLRRQRTAETRRRLGIWTMIAAAAYLALATVPFPRPLRSPRVPVTAQPTANLDGGNATPTASSKPTEPSTAIPATPAGSSQNTGSAPAGSNPGAPGPAAMPTEPSVENSAIGNTPRTVAIAGEPSGVHLPNDQPVPATGRIASHRTRTDLPLNAAAADHAGDAAAVTPWPWREGLIALAAAIAFLLLLHYAVGALRLFAILRRSTRACAATHALVPLPKQTRIVFAARSVRPFCVGVLRPVIVLSPELAGRPDALAAVLRHESAHLRARDPLVQALFALLALPLALHPLFWWLRARVRFESERLADERAAGAERTAYARQLLNLVDDSAPTAPAVSAMAIFHRRTAFYRRIQMLLQPKPDDQTPLSRTRRVAQSALLFGLVATAASAFGVEANAQDPARTRQATARYEAERAELEAEIAALKRQIRSLSEAVDRQNTKRKVSNFGTWKSVANRIAGANSNPGETTPPAEPPTPAPLDTASPPTAPTPHPLTTRARRGQFAPGDTTVPPPGQSPQPSFLPTTLSVDVRPGRNHQNPMAPPRAPRASNPGQPSAPLPNTTTFPGGRANSTARPPRPEPTPAPAAKRWPNQPLVSTARGPLNTQNSRSNARGGPSRSGQNRGATPSNFSAPRFAANNDAAASEAIVALTSRMLDLNTEIEIAKSKLEETKALANNSMVSKGQLRREMAQLANLERKRKIIRGLVDGEMKATKLELVWLKGKMKAASKIDRLRFEMQRERAEGRLDALRAAR
ncbi:MAG: hypothetical protein NXI31_25635 [bacterium]|nr:hypothetical protein [bacterium]